MYPSWTIHPCQRALYVTNIETRVDGKGIQRACTVAEFEPVKSWQVEWIFPYAPSGNYRVWNELFESIRDVWQLNNFFGFPFWSSLYIKISWSRLPGIVDLQRKWLNRRSPAVPSQVADLEHCQGYVRCELDRPDAIFSPVIFSKNISWCQELDKKGDYKVFQPCNVRTSNQSSSIYKMRQYSNENKSDFAAECVKNGSTVQIPDLSALICNILFASGEIYREIS